MNSQGGLLVPITWTLKGPSTHPERDQDKALVIEGLKAVGKKHSRSTGQVLLRWALEKNVSVIPGTGNPKHIKENLGVYDFSLSPEEVKQVDELSSDPIAEDFIFFKL
eukprot:g5336.t1